MASKKIPCCPKCGLPLEKETEPSIDYPYVCRFCDENFYEFESVLRNKGDIPKLTDAEKKLRITEADMVDQILLLNNDHPFVGIDYIRQVAEKIVRDVMKDIAASADNDDWNDNDLRMAIGRVLCKKLHVEM